MTHPKPDNELRKVGFQPTNPAQSDRFLPGPTHFLGIGINEYAHWGDLNNAVRDMRAVKDLLVTQYGLLEQNVHLLTDADASREGILDKWESLLNQVKPVESLLIYYAGHGHLDKKNERGYLVPHDGSRSSSSYIRNSTLRDLFEDCKAQHILFLSDACFSGSLLAERSRGDEEDLLAMELEQLPSRWVISSGRHDEEVADGPRGKHSPFAQSVLDVLGTPTRSAITTAFLGQAVQKQTKHSYKDQLPDYGPIYGVGDKRGQFVFWPEGRSAAPSGPAPVTEGESRNLSEDNTKADTPMTLDQFRNAAKQLLLQNRHRDALQFMEKSLKKDAYLQDTILMVLIQVNGLRKDMAEGLVTDERAQTRRARFSRSIKGILEDVKESEIRPDATLPEV